MMQFLLRTFLVALLLLTAGEALSQTSGPRVALFESEAFFDQKAGIVTLIQAQKELTQEMQPRLAELSALKQRVGKIEAEIRSASASQATPAWLRDKNDEASRILRELEFKQKEAEILQAKREKELIDPELVIVSREMIEFAKKRSIDILIDQSRTGGAIFPVSPTFTITFDFIKEFNSSRTTVPIK